MAAAFDHIVPPVLPELPEHKGFIQLHSFLFRIFSVITDKKPFPCHQCHTDSRHLDSFSTSPFCKQICLNCAKDRVQNQSHRLILIVPGPVFPSFASLRFRIESLIIVCAHTQDLIQTDNIERLFHKQECQQTFICLTERKPFSLNALYKCYSVL